ncbi:hypothetical protein HBI26_128010 [Parastagonospora nodorum]|nr:hypothetical protein HBI78_135030 [Parastagonospora nodorum]KAH5014160.1 hypothetical protein HBI74_184740 [Parastagonospora nodorum]KAH5208360.1 hypothetical protein HBI62_223090 [Parastagonospora nodorum]KAH5579159.1 hypothetical protein HBI26_128010 [Parastagonospora nodorum]KAH5998353.1 hypothetical protein HBI83_226640 [Parastagonospora nodorum]
MSLTKAQLRKQTLYNVHKAAEDMGHARLSGVSLPHSLRLSTFGTFAQKSLHMQISHTLKTTKTMCEDTHPLPQSEEMLSTRCYAPLTLSGPKAIPKHWNTIFSEEQLSLAAKLPVNIITLSTEECSRLLSGPKISIVADSNVVVRDNVPQVALMASSTKLIDLMQTKESVTQYRVFGNVDVESIERLLDIFTTKPGLEAKEVRLTGTNFLQDVLLYQACLSLGIYYVYTKPLLDALRREISARLITEEERNAIVNRTRLPDPLFKHIANDLCHRRIKKEFLDIKAFEKWLGHAKKKTLQSAMTSIDQEHEKRREVFRLGKKEELGKNMTLSTSR